MVASQFDNLAVFQTKMTTTVTRGLLSTVDASVQLFNLLSSFFVFAFPDLLA